MKPLSESRLFAWLCIILLFGILVGISTAAWAGGDEIKQVTHVENDVSTVLTAGDNISENSTSISGSRSYGVGLGSIDVDIAQCLGSESTGIVVIQWQRLKENPWCMADTLDAKGLHEAAAKVRCSIDFYRQIFADNQECIALSTASTQEIHGEQSATEDDDEHDREIDALYAALTDLEEKLVNDTNALRESHRRPQVQRQVVQQPYLTDEQKRALREAVK